VKAKHQFTDLIVSGACRNERFGMADFRRGNQKRSQDRVGVDFQSDRRVRAGVPSVVARRSLTTRIVIKEERSAIRSFRVGSLRKQQ
jgi:hypothetical protein